MALRSFLAAERHEVHMKKSKTMDDTKKARRKQLILVLVNVFLLLAVVAVIALLIVRSDWRYGLFERFRSRNPAQAERMQLVDSDCRAVSLHDLLEGKTEGIAFDRSLMLVNGEHRLAADFQPVTVEFRDTDLLIDEAVTEPLEALLQANSEATGEKLLLMSTFRDAEEQAQVKKEEGDLAAEPGTSEHQTGLGLDVYVAGKAQRRIIDSQSGVWLDQNGWKYGFIIRYPFLKSGETGQSYEPWHIRYVGKPHAELIYRNRHTLESYLDSLHIDVFYRFSGYGFSLQTPDERDCLRIPAAWSQVTVSPDNCGHYMVTGLLSAA